MYAGVLLSWPADLIDTPTAIPDPRSKVSDSIYGQVNGIVNRFFQLTNNGADKAGISQADQDWIFKDAMGGYTDPNGPVAKAIAILKKNPLYVNVEALATKNPKLYDLVQSTKCPAADPSKVSPMTAHPDCASYVYQGKSNSQGEHNCAQYRDNKCIPAGAADEDSFYAVTK